MSAKIETEGDWYLDQRFVCARPDGSLVPPDQISEHFRRLNMKAGMGLLRYYGLRHIHATPLLMNGQNPKIAGERLGHTDIRITLSTYIHVLPGMQKDAARRLNDLLTKDRPKEDK